MNPPTMIAGRYELLDNPVLGSMGEVYEALDTHLDRLVAVKVIRRDLLGGNIEHELVRRFQREARLTARAAHPGVPAVYDVGVDGNRHYLVMELVHGATVQDLIDAGEPVPLSWIAYVGAQVCAVLDRTHAISLIHRDLKPENLMLCPDGSVKVLDFGVALLVDGSASSTLTPPGVTAGTSRYQAPERMLGQATRLSDLYSLGRVLEDMLSHQSTDVPQALIRLIDELTAAHPQDRPGSAAEVYRRLRPLVSQLGPLPGFVNRAGSDSRHLYVDLLKLLPATASTDVHPQQSRRPHLTSRQTRAQAESYAADGQFSYAISLLDDAIAAVTDSVDPALADLHRDLARILVEAGENERAVHACAAALDAMAPMVPAGHPAALAMRLAQARAHARHGDATAARILYQSYLDDLPSESGRLPSEAIAARRELALQLAMSGETHAAVGILTALLDDHGNDSNPDVTREALAAIQITSGHAGEPNLQAR